MKKYKLLHACPAITLGRFHKDGIEYCGICRKPINNQFAFIKPNTKKER